MYYIPVQLWRIPTFKPNSKDYYIRYILLSELLCSLNLLLDNNKTEIPFQVLTVKELFLKILHLNSRHLTFHYLVTRIHNTTVTTHCCHYSLDPVSLTFPTHLHMSHRLIRSMWCKREHTSDYITQCTHNHIGIVY